MMKTDPHCTIRTATSEDAEDAAQLHVEVWRDTYRGIATTEAYETLDAARRLPYWRATLIAEEPTTGALIAVSGDEAAGIVSFGPSSEPVMHGATEIKHLYVRDRFRGTGLGKRLLTAAFDHLVAQDSCHIALAVVRENASARAFYRAMGGSETGAFTDAGPLWRSSNIVVHWQLDTPLQA